MTIEPMTIEDIPQILEIERNSFSIPYSETMYRSELELDVAHLYVMRQEGRVCGYLDFWLVEPEIHLITVAVHPGSRRKGVGSALLKFLVNYASKKSAESIALDVRVSNKAAISLYKKFGFKKVGLRKGYYHDNNEDAALMTLVV